MKPIIRYSPEFKRRLLNAILKKRKGRMRGRTWSVKEDLHYQLSGQIEHYLEKLSYIMRWIVDKRKISLVLDAGTGFGGPFIAFFHLMSKHLGGKFLSILLDIDVDAVRIARERIKEHRLTSETCFLVADIRYLPLRRNVMDVCLSIAVLEHLAHRGNVIAAIREMFRVLKPGGLLYIQTENRLWPLDTHDTRLPFIRWLPDKIASFIARKLGLVDDTYMPVINGKIYLNHLPTYGEILIALDHGFRYLPRYRSASEVLVVERSLIRKIYFLVLLLLTKLLGHYVNWFTAELCLLLEKQGR